jgi:4a-hydroxytetrahydrobiopterin dehydratase
MTLLSDDEISERLSGLEGWELSDDSTIVSERKLEDFSAALDYVNRAGALAEAANHHPDILLHSWNKVRLTLSTHSEGGLTAADFELAGRLAELA